MRVYYLSKIQNNIFGSSFGVTGRSLFAPMALIYTTLLVLEPIDASTLRTKLMSMAWGDSPVCMYVCVCVYV